MAQLFGGFEEAFGKVHSSFLELVGVKNNDELVDMVSTQSKTYASKLQTIVGDLTEEVRITFKSPERSPN